MQTCSYCGKENDDGAFNCRECATELEAGARVRNVREAKEAAVADLGFGCRVRRGVKARALIYLSLAVSIGAVGYAAWVHQHSEQMAKQTLPRREAELVTLLAPTAAELQPLQGTWEGVELGHESNGKITITISGNSLHFRRGTNDWYETTLTLPAGTDPKQLRATIKRCSYPDHVGKVVVALFKIEDGTLTLAADSGSSKPPKSFEDEEAARYEFRKVQPQKKIAEASIFRQQPA
jgi:uncharacterized protein (TIGR03067 family)